MNQGCERFFEVSGDFLCVAGTDGFLKAVNPAMTAFLGYAPDAAALGKVPFADLIHDDDREIFLNEFERAKAGTTTSFSSRIRAADSSYKPLHWSGTTSREEGAVYFTTRYMALPLPAKDLLLPSFTDTAKNDDFFIALVRHLAAVLRVKHAFVAQCVDWPMTRVSTLGGWMFGKPTDNFEYTLAGTPCEKVLRGEACYFPNGIQETFPDDKFLIDIGCHSYLGIPLVDTAGALLGHMCVLDDKPMSADDREWHASVMSTFAAWAVTELERVRAEEAFAKVMEATAGLAGVDFLKALARNIANALQGAYVIISEYIGDPPLRARALAFFCADHFVDGFEHDIDGTPCADVSKGNTCHYADGLQEKFPRDVRLVELKAQSYLGIPLTSASGRQIGQLVVMDTKFMPASPRRARLLRLFAARTATQIERLRTEALAQENELRLNLVFENAADAIFVYAKSGALLNVNRAACESLGYEREELVGMTIEAVRDDAQRGMIESELDALTIGVPVTSEQRLKKRGGAALDVEVRTVLFELDGKTFVLALARDITDRKLAEESLHAAKTAAERANRAKSDFLSSMSHELRTPLNGILGYAQVLGRQQELSLKGREGVEIIKKSGEHLLTLLNDVLDLAKIEAGKIELTPKALSLATVVEMVAKLCRVRAEEKNIAFTCELKRAAMLRVYTDEKRLTQVLLNLLGNAIKFTDQGGVTLQVEAAEASPLPGSTGVAAHRVCFRVEDTGPGIAPEHIERIFEPFEQVGDQKARAEGTGLGLVITKRIVEQMGGTLNVHSELGKGSVFTATLILEEATSLDTEKKGIEWEEIEGYQGERRAILVVDDNAYNRGVLRDLLEPIGFEVLDAASGEEAVQTAASRRPAVIVMDISMPGMDGLEATRLLREKPELSDTVILVSSASVSQDVIDKSLSMGCNDVLPKPVRANEVLEKLERYLQLTWVWRPAEARSIVPPSVVLEADLAALPCPSREQTAQLLEIVKRGRVREILKSTHDLAESEPNLAPWLTHVQSLARRFEIRSLRELLAEQMKSTE